MATILIRNFIFFSSFITVCLPLLTSSAIADSGDANAVIDESFLEGFAYRCIGPYRGGRVTAVEGTASSPRTFYMGSTGGGVWKTENAGETWENISDGFFKAGSIGSIEVADSDPNVIYVGTGSDAPRGNISPGIGIYKSTDKGKTWEHSGLREGGQIGKIRAHPGNPDLVYAAVLGNIFGPNQERGVFRSKDGGENWEKILFLNDETGAIDINIDPNNPRILYAGFWRAERKPWTLIDGAEEGGVYRSFDGGDTWEQVLGGLPENELLGKVDIAVSPADSNRIWVLQQTAREETGGLYRSDDGGESWERVNGEHKLRQRQFYYTHLHADPVDMDTVYVLNTGFYKSTDAGKTFDRIQVPHGDVHDLWINPRDPDIMVNSNDGGANVTVDGGKSWTTQLNQPTSEFYRVEVDNQFPYRVYGAQQDNTTISVPGKPSNDVNPKQHWYSVGGGESGHIAVHPGNPDLVYAGSYSGEITRFNLRTGQVLQMTPYPHYTEGTRMSDLKYRFQWNFPIVISRHNPENIYVTSQYVHKSSDGGFNWKVISPDLTTSNPEYLDLIPGGPIQHDATGVEVYCSIFAFAESPHMEGEYWTGSDDGLVHLSRDGGENWTNITPPGMPKDGTINCIDLSSSSPGTAYVAVYRYRRADFAPYIFKTADYGSTWALLTSGSNGIPPDHFVRVVREDPDRQGLLYAGTEFGVYVSIDDGKHWQPLQLNLPHTPVTDIRVHEKDLVLSTQGRSFWILDDLSPLHQMEIQPMETDVFLFKPRDAYRTQLSGRSASPGPDPYPSGALFYFLVSSPVGELSAKLEVLDSKGDVVKCWSASSESGTASEKLEIRKGLNRVEWDLNYPGPFTVEDLVTMVMRNPAAGPEAVPGSYTVRLSAGDLEMTEAFDLRADPRWETSVSDLQQTFELAIDIRDMVSEFQNVIKEARSLREQVSKTACLAVRNGFPDGIRASADELCRKLSQLEALLINNNIKSGQDPIGMERRLSNRMGRLYQVVRDHDAAPTGGMRERFKDLEQVCKQHMESYDELIEKDLARFNDLLKKEGVDHILVP